MNRPPNKIVFFDGVCHLCNGSVKFLLKRNKKENLFFSPLQSDFAKAEFNEMILGSSVPDSIVYLKDGRLLFESSAALEICRELRFPWNLLPIFLIVPKFIRNGIYRLVAKNRYRWFGKMNECMIPDKEESKRFLF